MNDRTKGYLDSVYRVTPLLEGRLRSNASDLYYRKLMTLCVDQHAPESIERRKDVKILSLLAGAFRA